MEAVAKDFVLVLQHHPVVFMTLVSLVAFCIMYALAQLSEQGTHWQHMHTQQELGPPRLTC